MHSIITSFLLQSKECYLPGIGILQIRRVPAFADKERKQILPPTEEIIFKDDTQPKSTALKKYISYKKNVSIDEAEELINNFCKEWNERIDKGEKLTFETVGSIQKNADGLITFEKENTFNYLKPISVKSTYHRTEEPIPIKEAPAVSGIVEEKNDHVVVERSYWGLWALILLAAGSVIIFFYFKDHKLSGSTIGNQNHFAIDSAKATYNLPNK